MDSKFGFYPVIVCGTRSFTDYRFVESKLNKLLKNLPKEKVQIVSGCALGPDTLAIQYAKEYGYKLIRFPAQWSVYGKSAGAVRNTEMAEFSTHCIAFWDGYSSGTKDMIEKAQKYNLNLRVIKI